MTHSPVPPCYVLVLAAGEGRRFGGDKLVAELRGRPILDRVLDAIDAATTSGLVRATYVVVRGRSTPSAHLARAHGAIVVAASRAQEGLAMSLRAGLSRVKKAAPVGPAGVLIVLGDQPALRADVIEALIRRWRATGAPAIRPRYAGEPGAPGHPVLIGRALWPTIEQLEGDTGLGQVLAGTEVLTVDVPGTNPDIDTPDDLVRHAFLLLG